MNHDYDSILTWSVSHSVVMSSDSNYLIFICFEIRSLRNCDDIYTFHLEGKSRVLHEDGILYHDTSASRWCCWTPLWNQFRYVIMCQFSVGGNPEVMTFTTLAETERTTIVLIKTETQSGWICYSILVHDHRFLACMNFGVLEGRTTSTPE